MLRSVRSVVPNALRACAMYAASALMCVSLFAASAAFAGVPEVQALLKTRSPSALAAAEALVKAEPKNGSAWVALTQARVYAKRNEKAVEAGERAVELAPNDPQAHLWLGNAIGNRIGEVGMIGKMSLAPDLRDAFERAVKLDPSLVEARYALIEFYLQAPSAIGGGIDKARAQATAIGKYDRVRGLTSQARIAMHEKKTPQAIGFLESALALKPADTALRLQLIVLYQDAKRWPDAYTAIKKWIAEAPKFNKAQYQLGRLAAESGRYLEEGEAALRVYLTMPRASDDPKPQNARYRLGQVLAKAGRKDEARAEFQAALKLDPKMKEAKEALAAL
ncbi:MAG: tetratricopeptide repeat protein [Xanthomonadaceae bacterium]|nr:tetratricopeptide repeat protein [Xanthomonadaceae bacterium]